LVDKALKIWTPYTGPEGPLDANQRVIPVTPIAGRAGGPLTPERTHGGKTSSPRVSKIVHLFAICV
jgi:hypothetical protein